MKPYLLLPVLLASSCSPAPTLTPTLSDTAVRGDETRFTIVVGGRLRDIDRELPVIFKLDTKTGRTWLFAIQATNTVDGTVDFARGWLPVAGDLSAELDRIAHNSTNAKP